MHIYHSGSVDVIYNRELWIISTETEKLFSVFKKSMYDALAACFHQQELVSESIVVGENTNNGRF